MNNREAITLLRNLEDSLDSYCELNEEGKTAFRMAIEALSCSEFPNSSDTIYRQAAIDALADMHCKSDEDGYVWIIRSDAWARIDALPAVTPKQEHGKWEEKAVSDEKVIDEWQSARCSACGKYHTAPYMYYFNNYNFCPNCGARMTKEDV